MILRQLMLYMYKKLTPYQKFSVTDQETVKIKLARSREATKKVLTLIRTVHQEQHEGLTPIFLV